MESAYITRTNQLYEYIKLHKISLEQDLADISDKMESMDPNSKDYVYLDIEYNWINGQITATAHLLSVAADILGQKEE